MSVTYGTLKKSTIMCIVYNSYVNVFVLVMGDFIFHAVVVFATLTQVIGVDVNKITRLHTQQ